jgi:hypothetical protein
MPTSLDVARDANNMNQLFASRLESGITANYLLLSLILEMSMDQRKQAYSPTHTFSDRAAMLESLKQRVAEFKVKQPEASVREGSDDELQ